MIPVALAAPPVAVQSSFITDIIIMIVVAAIIGIGIGGFLIYRMIGYSGRAIWSARRKKIGLILHLANNRWSFWPAKRNRDGTWESSVAKIRPNEKAVHPLIGGVPIAIAYRLPMPTPTEEFMYFSQRYADKHPITKQNPHPPTLNELMDALLKRQKKLENVVMTIGNVVDRRITLEQAAFKLGIDRYGLADLQEAVKNHGAEYVVELKKVNRAIAISDEVTFKLKMGTDGHVSDVISEGKLNVDDFLSTIPTGANLAELRSGIKRAESASISEGAFTPAQAMKYLMMSAAIFIILLGIRVVIG